MSHDFILVEADDGTPFLIPLGQIVTAYRQTYASGEERCVAIKTTDGSILHTNSIKWADLVQFIGPIN